MLLKDHWYIASPAIKLTATKPIAVQIGADNLALFRDGEGVAHALLDRCCHRGVKLSCGRITNGNIACGYHGWEYDGSGALVKVPSLPEGTEVPGYKVPTYQVTETADYIWVWIAGDHSEPTYQPELTAIDLKGTWLQQTAIWDVSIMDAVENQMDGAHTPFSHPGTYPTHHTDFGQAPPLKEFDAECRISEGTVEFFSPPTKSEDEPMPHWSAVGFWAAYELPYRNYVFLNTEGVKAIYNWIPLADGRCRLEFMTYHSQEAEGPTAINGRDVIYSDEELEILRQDRVLLESAHEWVKKGRRSYEKSVSTDFPQLQSRRMQRAALAGAKPDLPKGAVRRHVFSFCS